LEVQKEIEVEYVTMPGWTEDIANVRKFEDLPEAAQNYVRAVEKYTGLPGELSLVGTFEMRKCDQGIWYLEGLRRVMKWRVEVLCSKPKF
jgi:adenylosuccinate synthase